MGVTDSRLLSLPACNPSHSLPFFTIKELWDASPKTSYKHTHTHRHTLEESGRWVYFSARNWSEGKLSFHLPHHGELPRKCVGWLIAVDIEQGKGRAVNCAPFLRQTKTMWCTPPDGETTWHLLYVVKIDWVLPSRGFFVVITQWGRQRRQLGWRNRWKVLESLSWLPFITFFSPQSFPLCESCTRGQWLRVQRRVVRRVALASERERFVRFVRYRWR